MSLFGKPDINKLKDKKDIDGLLKALSHKDDAVRDAAAEALSQIGDTHVVDRLIASLKYNPMGVYTLVKIGAPAVGPLISALENIYIKEKIIDALGQIGDARAVNALIIELDGREKYSAAKALVKIGAPAVEPLIALIKDQCNHVIIDALGEIGDPRAVCPLIKALEFISIRRAVIMALGQIGDPRAVDAIIEAFAFRDEKVRQCAADALVRIGNPAVNSLGVALKDAAISEDAAKVLVKIGLKNSRRPSLSRSISIGRYLHISGL